MGGLLLLQQPRGYTASWNWELVGSGCCSNLEVIQPPGMGGLLLLQQSSGYITSWNGQVVAAVVGWSLYSILEWAGCGCCMSLGLYSLLEWVDCGCCSSLEVIQPPGMGGLLLLQQSRGYIASWNGRAVAAVVAQRLYSLLEWVGCGCSSNLEVTQPPGMGWLWLLWQPRGYIGSWNGRAVAALVAQRLYSLLEWMGCGCCSSLEVIQPPGMGGLWLLQQPKGYIASWNGRAVAAVVVQRLFSLLELAGCCYFSSLEVIQPPGMGGLWLLQQPRGHIASWNGWAVAAVVAQRLYSLLEWASCCCSSSLEVIQLEKRHLFSLLMAKLSTLFYPCLNYSLICGKTRMGGCQVCNCF